MQQRMRTLYINQKLSFFIILAKKTLIAHFFFLPDTYGYERRNRKAKTNKETKGKEIVNYQKDKKATFHFMFDF